jgi:hypothetical protein
MTFKTAQREIQELVRELTWVRQHNLTFKEGDSQEDLLMFSEAALVLIALERFLRMILGAEVTDRDTLPNLLEKATGARLALLTLPVPDRQRAIREVTNVRNTILHGTYEQAAHQAGCVSVPDYFKKQFTPEVEHLYHLTNMLVAQIDQDTGKPR